MRSPSSGCVSDFRRCRFPDQTTPFVHQSRSLAAGISGCDVDDTVSIDCQFAESLRFRTPPSSEGAASRQAAGSRTNTRITRWSTRFGTPSTRGARQPSDQTPGRSHPRRQVGRNRERPIPVSDGSASRLYTQPGVASWPLLEPMMARSSPESSRTPDVNRSRCARCHSESGCSAQRCGLTVTLPRSGAGVRSRFLAVKRPRGPIPFVSRVSAGTARTRVRSYS